MGPTDETTSSDLRRLIVLVALVAIGLFVYREFEQGIPPRFITRGIPARIALLKPGMTQAQAEEILGVKRSWLLGGTNSEATWGRGGADYLFQEYEIGEFPARAIVGVCYHDLTLGYLPPRDDNPLTVI